MRPRLVVEGPPLTLSPAFLFNLDPRAHAAAVTALRAHAGIDDDTPQQVLANGSNYVLRAGGAVARVATTTGFVRPDPQAYAARELSVVRFLAARGVAVTAPLDGAAAGPFVVDDLVVTLWRYVAHDPAVRLSVDEVRPLLARLHDVLAGYDGAPLLPFLGGALDDARHAFAAAVAASAFAAAGVSSADVDRLLRAHDDVAAALAPLAGDPGAQALHGDAHAKNLLVTPAGPVWSDFEDACRGPRAWDLACLLRRAAPAAVAHAVAPAAALSHQAHEAPPASGDTADTADTADTLRLLLRARHLQAIPWLALFALRFPARRLGADLDAAVRAVL